MWPNESHSKYDLHRLNGLNMPTGLQLMKNQEEGVFVLLMILRKARGTVLDPEVRA